MSEQITMIKEMPVKGEKFNIKVGDTDKGAYKFNSVNTDKSDIHFDKDKAINTSTTSPDGIDVPFTKNADTGDYEIDKDYEITKLATGGKRKYNKSKKSRNSKKSRKSRKSRR